MIIILSRKIDTDSSYTGDEVFRVYHYPARYKNQIHTGDTFVYYQGKRYDKSQRYYFGTGRIGKIEQEDEYNSQLKKAIQNYYIANDRTAVLEIIEIAQKLAGLYNL
jgi:hypothetical protein